MANPKASASNQAADRDGGHVLNLSICCCEETTLGGSRPRRPRRSLSVTENAVPCSSQQHQKVQNPLEKARPGQSQGAPPPRRERPDGTGRDGTGAGPRRTYPVEPGVVEDVGPALVEDDGAVALRRHVLPRVLGEEELEAAQAVGGEGSPEIPRDGRHPRAGGCFPGRLWLVASSGPEYQREWSQP